MHETIRTKVPKYNVTQGGGGLLARYGVDKYVITYSRVQKVNFICTGEKLLISQNKMSVVDGFSVAWLKGQ